MTDQAVVDETSVVDQGYWTYLNKYLKPGYYYHIIVVLYGDVLQYSSIL